MLWVYFQIRPCIAKHLSFLNRVRLESHHHILPGFFYLPGFRTLAFSPTSEKAMAPHSSTLAWKIPWTEEPGRLQSLLRVRHDWATSLSLSCIGEGNGNPLQCSCLENPRDGGAWWAAIYGVAQSRTWLKWLSSLAAVVLRIFSIFPNRMRE